ncbi:MAG: hypothetical protein GXP63_05005 [DPANN group archaeon]|nr:hypothetical protein [DPANN group archaeon]
MSSSSRARAAIPSCPAIFCTGHRWPSHQLIILVLALLSSMAVLPATRGYAIGMSSSSLDFGELPPDSSFQRNIQFSTDSKTPVVLELTVDGALGQWMTFPKTVEVRKGLPRSIALRLIIPDQVPLGTYRGLLVVTGRQDTAVQGQTPVLITPGIIREMQVEITEQGKTPCVVKAISFVENGDYLRIRADVKSQVNLEIKPTLLLSYFSDDSSSDGIKKTKKTKEWTMDPLAPFSSDFFEVHWKPPWRPGSHRIKARIGICNYSTSEEISYRTMRTLGKGNVFPAIKIGRKEATAGNPFPVQATFTNLEGESLDVQLVGRAVYPNGSSTPFSTEPLRVESNQTQMFIAYLTLPKGTYSIEAKFIYGPWESIERGTTVTIRRGTAEEGKGESFSFHTIGRIVALLVLLAAGIFAGRLIRKRRSGKG